MQDQGTPPKIPANRAVVYETPPVPGTRQVGADALRIHAPLLYWMMANDLKLELDRPVLSISEDRLTHRPSPTTSNEGAYRVVTTPLPFCHKEYTDPALAYGSMAKVAQKAEEEAVKALLGQGSRLTLPDLDLGTLTTRYQIVAAKQQIEREARAFGPFALLHSDLDRRMRTDEEQESYGRQIDSLIAPEDQVSTPALPAGTRILFQKTPEIVRLVVGYRLCCIPWTIPGYQPPAEEGQPAPAPAPPMEMFKAVCCLVLQVRTPAAVVVL